jgi:hypothetical protein
VLGTLLARGARRVPLGAADLVEAAAQRVEAAGDGI